MKAFYAELRRWTEAAFPNGADTFVPGDGERNARVMLIGEAPGEREAALGRPFVGKAGKNLDAFLQAAGLNRSQMLVTNAVKFRPTRVSKAGRTVNRPPTRAEIEAFRPWLMREIELVAPEWIVTMGNVPLKATLGGKETVGQVHGRAIEWMGRKLYPIYHPASLIYNPSLKSVYEEDLLRFNTLLSRIS